jgi:ADP-heptose:LPS heptosyltransferase
VILAPLIAGLRAAGHRLDILLSERNRAIFAPNIFETTHSVPWNAWKTRDPRRDFAPLLTTLRTHAYDAALIATEEIAAYRLAHALAIPQRCGFENGWGKPLKTLLVRSLCTGTVHRPASLGESAHEARVQYRLAEGFGASTEPTRDLTLLQPLFLTKVPARGETIAVQITPKWRALGISSHMLTRIVACAHEKAPVRLLASSDDANLAQEIRADGETPIDVFEELHPWKQAIAQAKLLITPDTGAAHLAGMLGTPTIDCFPERHFRIQAARWAPWATPSTCLPVGTNQEALFLRIRDALTFPEKHLSFARQPTT